MEPSASPWKPKLTVPSVTVKLSIFEVAIHNKNTNSQTEGK